jgi:hypothetical protein
MNPHPMDAVPRQRCNVCCIWVWDGDGRDTDNGTTCHDCHTHDPTRPAGWGDDPRPPRPGVSKRTRDHLTGQLFILLVWLFYFGGAALQELGCNG